MAGGVAGRLDHAADQRADLHHVALAHRDVDAGNLLRFLARRDHAALVLLLQRLDAGGMIGVMVRDQNVGEPPPLFGKRGFDRRGFRRVDRGRRAGGGIVQQDAEIVLQAHEKMGFCRHACVSLPGGGKLAWLYRR